MANENKFFNAGLPKDTREAIHTASKEATIGRAKYHLLSGLFEHNVQFDPSTVKLATVDICGELYVTSSVIIPLNSDYWLGVEYQQHHGRFSVWVHDKNGEVCTRGKDGGSVSYDSKSLSYCLAMCFSWLYLGGCNE